MIKSTNGRKKNCNYSSYSASDTVTTVRKKKKRTKASPNFYYR